MMGPPTRYTNHELPPYTYVPGREPHPLSHADGHGCPGPEHRAVADLQRDWRQSATYLWGIDLFNHGFFWEAHEAWEELWLEAKQQPTTALWIKGLIKLAAAGVKALEGQPEGVRRHARRAAEIFSETKPSLPEPTCGLDTGRLERCAEEVASAPEDAIASVRDQRGLLGRLLELRDEQRSAQQNSLPPPRR